MIVIPAVDILGGRCVRLLQGDYSRVTEYAEDPVRMALTWEERGAERLHVVDLDGARAGKPVNNDAILTIAESLNIPIEVGGGIRSTPEIEGYLDGGVDRVILGTAAFREPGLLEEASKDFPTKVWVGIDSRDGRVAVEGWTEETARDAYDLAASCRDLGAGGIIFTDIRRDGTLEGPNLEALRTMAERVALPLIASGGISSLRDLEAIRDLGLSQVEGIITGKALYAGMFTLEEAIDALKE